MRVLIVAIALLLAQCGAFAATGADPFAEQRRQYRAAMSALERGDPQPFLRARSLLAGYPLYPYLELAQLRRRLPAMPVAEVEDFLARHGDGLPAARLRAAWLPLLASHERWQEFLRHYVEDPANTERRCDHARARLMTGATAEADRMTAQIWAAPRSLPKACDPLFQAWTARGNPAPALAWQRFHAAMEAGQTGLAQYLTRFLDAPARADATLFLRVADAPALVQEPARFAPGNPRHAQIVAFGLSRLAARDAHAARSAFEHHARAAQPGPVALGSAAPRIANALAADSPRSAMRWIMGLDARMRSDALVEDAVRHALRGEGWDDVLATLDLLPAPLAATERWQYWAARSREGRTGSPGGSHDTYAQLGATRSYYGFLAADRIGRGYAMQHQPLPVADELLQAVERAPGIQRAHEFELLGDTLESRREWLHTTGLMNQSERLAAARIASSRGWHQLAIGTLIAAGEWNALEMRFPTVHAQDFARAARQQRVEQNWLYAIARQESALNPTVRSPAGALGLMQVMPTTAELTARKAGIRYRGSTDLLDPATNVVIGSHYMRTMLDQFQQNRVLAAAAYNAGPGRVKRWLRQLPATVEHDRFVETIPFRETRQYVQNVLSFTVIYAYLEGREVPLVQPAERLIRNPYRLQAENAG
ncbi:MAG: transglycosylase SLT domain-containing protein [Pseudomonadales bacterium]|jgi:soluble lytic murein transglycosylase|nr:transglycosylase SLT domain-containing protein [Pseudomonadales bacterium]